MRDLENLTFETNGTQHLHEDFKRFLMNDYHLRKDQITFSVSPKLSASGEKWSDAVKPEVVAEYQTRGFTYLKFVVDKAADFEEVDAATAEYREAGFKGPVFVMPVGGTDEMYNKNLRLVADEALVRGYNISPRLHCTIWGNGWAK
jgi:organic radical activating enzyme